MLGVFLAGPWGLRVVRPIVVLKSALIVQIRMGLDPDLSSCASQLGCSKEDFRVVCAMVEEGGEAEVGGRTWFPMGARATRRLGAELLESKATQLQSTSYIGTICI